MELSLARAIIEVCGVWGDEHLTNIWQTGLILSNIAQNQLWYIWISRYSYVLQSF